MIWLALLVWAAVCAAVCLALIYDREHTPVCEILYDWPPVLFRRQCRFR